MKKISRLITLLILVAGLTGRGVYAQGNKQKEYSDTVTVDTTASRKAHKLIEYRRGEQINALRKDHYFQHSLFDEILGVRYNGGVRSADFEVYEGTTIGRSVIISGVCPVEFSALGITPQTAADFLYHVVLDDRKELVGWTKPSVFKNTPDGTAYAYLGKFSYPGHLLKIEIQSVKNYARRGQFTVDWRKISAPKVSGTIQYISRRFPIPDNELIGRSLTELKQVTVPIAKTWVNSKWRIDKEKTVVTDFLATTDKNDPKLRLADSIKKLLFLINNSWRPYYYKVSLKRTVDGITDSINLGQTTYGFELYKEFWDRPGEYRIYFTPKLVKPGGNPIILRRDLATSIKFTVLPALSHTYTLPLKTVAYIVLIIVTTGAFMFVMYRSGQKRKLAAEAKDKQVAMLQLASVRSQLNPHFIFNALAGIQNLMNKNEVENANKYLSRFARLTRNILDDGNKELTSIEKETALLTDYLQMEQTRFGFSFSIDVDANVDQLTEIPAMLLQPFAENAVKHGVSALKDKGIIKISITKQGPDLLLTVQDNGSGFANDQADGMGFKLCRERIALLNTIYKKSSILLKQTSGNAGTLISIELRGWV
ncbi:sensor histidine kinase [Mucilaginibacter myungsuensis]|nr:histidine kinase [Mucilaginibacter myungsuensis]MDN3600052.1 histidine kinase [Mucilaginibacter myungsuensis]